MEKLDLMASMERRWVCYMRFVINYKTDVGALNTGTVMTTGLRHSTTGITGSCTLPCFVLSSV